jgi:CHASE1-domain containing sensor protein
MRAVRRSAIPVLVFLLGLIATVAAATLVARTEAGRRQARFEGLVNSVAAAVESRMLSQLTLLRGAAGLFNASDDVSREEFQAYVSRLRLQRNSSGCRGTSWPPGARPFPPGPRVNGRAIPRSSTWSR